MSSTSSGIHEYGFHFNGFGNVTFIDTPGIGSADGLENDAQILASLQHLLEKTSKEATGSLPDIVLLCHRFDDNRFNEERSTFIKMLKSLVYINELWLSQEDTNIALLLTRAGTAGNTKVDVADKLKLFKGIAEEYLNPISLSTEMNILLGENKGEAQALLKENLAEFNITSYIIPFSNQSYPENVCQFFTKVLEGNPSKVKVVQLLCQRKFSSIELVATHDLLGTSDTKVKEMTEYLTKITRNISSTPVSITLNSAYNAMHGNSSALEDDLAYLQKALNIQGVINLEDIPRTDVELRTLFEKLRVNENLLKLLDVALQITVPKLPDNLNQVGFNYLEITNFIPRSLFDIEQYQYSTVGYDIPKSVSCALVPLSERIWISEEEVGFLYIHYRFMHCQLQDNVEILPEYITKLNSLRNFNAADYETVFEWKNFLDEFGFHLIRKGYVGGMVTLYDDTEQPISNPSNNLTAYYTKQNLINQLKNQLNSSTDWKITTIGGNSKYYTNSLQNMLAENGKLFKTWIKSILDFPVVTLIDTVPIEDYLEIHNYTNEAIRFSEAKDFFAALPPNGFEESLIDKIKELKVERYENCLN